MAQQQPAGTGKPLSDRLPIFSLLTGILAVVSCCAPPQQMLFGISAILAAYLSKQGKPLRGMAFTGMILGIISIICSLAVFFIYMWTMQTMGDPANADLVKEVLRQYQVYMDYLQTQLPVQ